MLGLAAALLVSSVATAAATSEQATLQAAFTPNRLGAATTISFGFRIMTADGAAPSPMTQLRLHMPAGIDYSTTTLGLAICRPAALLAKGLDGCSPNSRVGFGDAHVEVPFGVGAGHELPQIQALMGPPHDGNIVVLFYANGRTPVEAELVFTGEVLPDSGIFGSKLEANVPPIASVPGGPDVSIVSVHATIGPRGLTYYRHSHGRLIAFHPVGVSLPGRCPRGGFPFSAQFGFEDGTGTTASTRVPCPPRQRHG